ncbi:MAG: PQQ-binding-like beta-propeller repeat protein [Ardenticatenales bacterium]|nr:PQQ-binding-like beta-propeller repeat protein [Ardenticatenales bacterium]
MKRTMESSLKYMMVCGLILAAGIISLSMQAFIAKPVFSVPTLPVLWTAGGLDPGNTGAGQAARIASDASGNVAVVSGPSLARDLAVTSYTASGSFRWRSAVTPATGTFAGDWVVAAPNGDFVAVGHNLTAGGQSIAITMVRYASDGTLLWQVDLARTLPSVARLEVDAGGNVYLAFSSVGDGQDIQLHKYDPSGNLLWSQVISTGFFANDYATSLALSPDGADVMLTGDIAGGATWITAAFNATTGVRAWLVTAAEGVAAKDVVVDDSHVYVTGQGNVGINSFLTVVAYDRATGARLWRTDKKPTDATGAAGLRMDIAPDGSLVVTGQANRGFLDWYTVSFETTGVVRWEAVRDGGLNTDEVPTGVLVLADGTAVVTGPGGPNLPGGFIPGVTVGYSSNGTLLWDAFAQLSTVWVTSLPNGDVCATGGYDALITCWRPSSGMSTPTPPPGPTSTPAPPANTGFLSPSANTAQTSGAGDNDGYQTSPVNAYTNDSLLSVAVDTDSGTNTNISCTDSGKDKHLYYNYNLNMPASAIIQGIQVRLGARVDATGGSPKICVQLSWDGGTSWTTAKATANLGTTETTYTLGSVLTTWGRTWNASDFNNGNFRLRVIDVAGDTNRDFFLDYVTVNVTFQP